MRLSAGLLILVLATSAGRAQGDRLAGRWEGTVQSPQGERKAAASFKKEAAGYTGTITGLRGDIAFKEVKVEGDKILATAEVEAQGTTIAIKYEFDLAGDDLKGKGEVDFNGQVFSFNYDLKRAAEAASGAQSVPAQPPQRRESVPQPVQQQSRDYFAGQWKFKWLGRDSPLSTGGPREGTATFRPVVDGKFLELVTEGKSESGAYRELGYLGYDSEKKSVTLFEARGNGIALLCVGDWSSPVSIRFSVAPVQAGGQTLRLKRTINVVAAHSWTMVEELSVDGGPFQRLGNAIYTKVGAEGAKE